MRIFTPCLIMLGILVWPGMGLAIEFNNGSWTTSFDYSSECSMRGNVGAVGNGVDCQLIRNDNILWSWGANMVSGYTTQAVADANNPNGDGGLGFRAWNADGVNLGSAPVRIGFPSPQKELWIRWYQRYQVGFAWSGGGPDYDKTLYMHTNGSTAVLPLDASRGGYSIASQGSPKHYQANSQPNVTWNDVFGSTSDGQFHMFEIHLKMDTNSSNGIGRMWIDGNLVIDATNIDYSGGSGVERQGWAWFEFHSNQKSPANGRPFYVDYDDLAIYKTTPPNIDPNGLPWIGPVNGFSGAGSLARPMSPAPVGVSFFDSIEDSNFASRGWYDKTSMVLANSGATSGSTKPIE